MSPWSIKSQTLNLWTNCASQNERLNNRFSCDFFFLGVLPNGYLIYLLHWHTNERMTNFGLFRRYNNDLELEDAIHTAILTLKVCGLM